MENLLKPLVQDTRLFYSLANTKQERNIAYLLSLKNDNLLLSFYQEAGLLNITTKKTDIHWGWDSPLSNIRGTFTGHFLSAAARIVYQTNHLELKVKAEYIVTEIARCQKENGGRWAFPIPEKYLCWVRDGKRVWAPQYVCHKIMMGLLDMYIYLNNELALEVLKGCADWFYDFTNDISRDKMSDMMDFEETGGIMEAWADLYSITNDEKHLALMRRYERPRAYEPLLKGEDSLTNVHANTTVPEMLGVARAYEVTGEARYKDIVKAYWQCAVSDRGMFVTGGQTGGEVWTPMQRQSARLSDTNQEHCVVYNMMRLARYLYSWTGESQYADYWERNLYNGIFAQGYYEETLVQIGNEDIRPKKGHVAYYLPLRAGLTKLWGSETEHFWCCHCTLVQANANVFESIYFMKGNDLVVSQYINSETKWQIDGEEIYVSQWMDNDKAKVIDKGIDIASRPNLWAICFEVKGRGKRFGMRFRLPGWLMGEAQIAVNGEKVDYVVQDGHLYIEREFGDDEIVLLLPKGLQAVPLPDRKNQVAFIDGPVALAALSSEQRMLYGDINKPENILVADDERRWGDWLPGYRTVGQPVSMRFVPIYDIGYEPYTVYFEVEEKK